MRKQKRQKNKGITLIALVITIIVLIILVGVTITALVGEDQSIIDQANNVRSDTEIATVKERVRTDISGKQAGNKGELTKSKFIEILNKYFKDVPKE